MNIDNLKNKIEKIFIGLDFKYEIIGERKYRYLVYNNCYCKITYLEKLKAFVIESTDNIKDALNGVLEDGDLYFIDISEENLLCQIKRDITRYYMN